MIYQGGSSWIWNLVVAYGVFQVGVSFVALLSNSVWSSLLLRLRPKTNLRLQVFVFVIALLSSPLSYFFQNRSGLAPVLIKTESLVQMKGLGAGESLGRDGFGQIGAAEYSSVENSMTSSWAALSSNFSFRGFEILLLIFFLGLLVFTFGSLLMDYRRMGRIVQRAHLLRQVGSVCLVVSSEIEIGFAWRSIFTKYVVVPMNILTHRERFKSVVFHELQHHRQFDTILIYFLRAIEMLSLRNPLLMKWTYNISELQEFACDESLLDRKLSFKGYTRDLVEVASQISMSNPMIPRCAPGIVDLASGSQLTRRIQLMFHFKEDHPRVWSKNQIRLGGMALLTGVIALSAFAATAVGSVIQVSTAREINRVQFEQLVAAKPDRRVFVSPAQKVLEGLNEYVGTQESRRRVRAAMERMRQLEPMLARTAAEYHAPRELFAIPFVESMYQNLPQEPVRGVGAGLWMFIRSTANNFGLNVSGNQDERLDIEKSTDAALRMLKADKLRFGTWKLAILAYNAGSDAVQAAIDQTGSREGWDLIRAGLRTDRNYLGRVMAMILILENPDLIRD